MLKVGIVGYGNLGIAVEREIMANKGFKLVKIFSRRNKKSSSRISKKRLVFKYYHYPNYIISLNVAYKFI